MFSVLWNMWQWSKTKLYDETYEMLSIMWTSNRNSGGVGKWLWLYCEICDNEPSNIIMWGSIEYIAWRYLVYCEECDHEETDIF